MNSLYRLDSFERWLGAWGASAATISKRLHIAGVIARLHPDPSSVTTTDLAAYLATPTFAPWTRTTYYGHLRSLFGWLEQENAIPADPTARLRRPSPPGNKPRPLTMSEVTLAVGSAEGHLRTWLLLGMLGGLRAHETAKLHGGDINADSIFIRGKGGKDAMVPTHPALWEIARHYPQHDYWFPSGWTHLDHVRSSTVTSRVTAHFEDLGIVGSYHRCRHTYGTNLLRSGVNLRIVQSLMRHTSLATTAAYLAVDEDERTAAIRGLAA